MEGTLALDYLDDEVDDSLTVDTLEVVGDLQLLTSDGAVLREHSLHLGENRVGRSDVDTDVVVDNPTVSSSHCLIDIQPQQPSVFPSSLAHPFFTPQHTLLDLDAIFITDLGSSNHTHLGTATFQPSLTSSPPPLRLLRDKPRLLRHGQHLFLGSQCARFMLWKYEQGVQLATKQRPRRSSVDSRASTQLAPAVAAAQTQMMPVDDVGEPGEEAAEPGAMVQVSPDISASDEGAERALEGGQVGMEGPKQADDLYAFDLDDTHSGNYQTLQSDDFELDMEPGPTETTVEGQSSAAVDNGAAAQGSNEAGADGGSHPPPETSTEAGGGEGGNRVDARSAGREVALSAAGADSDPLDIQLLSHHSEDGGHKDSTLLLETIPSSDPPSNERVSPGATLPLPSIDELSKSPLSPLSSALSSAGGQAGRKQSARSRRQPAPQAEPHPSSSDVRARLEEVEQLCAQEERRPREEEMERVQCEQEMRLKEREDQRRRDEEEQRTLAEEQQKREKLERERVERAEAERVERLKAEEKERQAALQRRREREMEEQREEEAERQRELQQKKEREEKAKAARLQEEQRLREERERQQREREEANRLEKERREEEAKEEAKASLERERSASAAAAQLQWRPKPRKKRTKSAAESAPDDDDVAAPSTPSKRTPRKQGHSAADRPAKKRAVRGGKARAEEERAVDEPLVDVDQQEVLDHAAATPVTPVESDPASDLRRSTRARSAAVVMEVAEFEDADVPQPVKSALSTDAVGVKRRGKRRRDSSLEEVVRRQEDEDEQRARNLGEEEKTQSADSPAAGITTPTKGREEAVQVEEAVVSMEAENTQPLAVSVDDASAALSRSAKTQEAMEVLEDFDVAKVLTSPFLGPLPTPVEEPAPIAPALTLEVQPTPAKRSRTRSVQSTRPSPASATSPRSDFTARPTRRSNSGPKTLSSLKPPTSTSPTSSSSSIAHSTRRTTAIAPSLLFTGIEPTMYLPTIDKLGGSITQSPSLASHLVSDRVRRTGKFLSAYPLVPHIVGTDFLDASAKAGHWVHPEPHALQDEDAEQRWGFTLRTRHIGAQCFEGWRVYATPHVQPEREAMRGMVEAAGGRLMEQQPGVGEVRVLVVGCEEDEAQCAELSKRGFTVYDKEAVLCALLRQKVEPHDFVLRAASSGGARGRGRSTKTPTG